MKRSRKSFSPSEYEAASAEEELPMGPPRPLKADVRADEKEAVLSAIKLHHPPPDSAPTEASAEVAEDEEQGSRHAEQGIPLASVSPPSFAPPELEPVRPTRPERMASPQLTLPGSSSSPFESLELRVQRLERTVKEIQETRVTDRPAPRPPPGPSLSLPSPPIDPPAPVAPVAIAAAPIPVASVAVPAPAPPLATPAPATKKSWLLTEMWAEARAIQFMFFDPRYSMSWGCRLMPLLLLIAFVTTRFWLPGANLLGLGFLIEKVVELVLGFALFKVLGHEARRYRLTAPDLPPSLRL